MKQHEEEDDEPGVVTSITLSLREDRTVAILLEGMDLNHFECVGLIELAKLEIDRMYRKKRKRPTRYT